MCLKMQRAMLNCRGLDVDSWIIEHIQLNKAKMYTIFTELMVRLTQMRDPSAAWRSSSLKRNKLFLNQKRYLHTRKRHPTRN